MSLWKIAWRSIQQRAVSSSLTAVSMALGVALVVTVLVIMGVVGDSFTQNAEGFDLIVGAKGGKMQLVLNTVFHLSQPIENVPWSYYQEFRTGKYAPMVSVAIPFCLGDNYQGFRVVGTTPEMFDDFEYRQGKKYAFEDGGRNFRQEAFFEGVIGSIVARRTGLKVGDRFEPTHGISGDEGHKHDAFEVVGVLEPTGTPNDRAVFINMEGFFLLEGHAKPTGDSTTSAGPTEAGESEHDHDADDGEDAHEHHEEDHEHAAGEKASASTEHHDHEEHEQDKTETDAVTASDDGESPGTADAGAEAQDADDHSDHDGHDEDEDGAEEHGHDEHEHDHPEADHGEHEHGDHDHGGHDHGDHDHGHAHHEPLPDDQREVTAILVRTANPISMLSLPRMVNKEPYAQAVAPTREIYNLFETIVGPVRLLLLVLTVLVIVVAGVGVMVSIYNSMNDRRQEMAVMRALGAGRSTVMIVVLLESILLSVGGGVMGALLGHFLVGAMSSYVVEYTGVSLGFLQFDQYELALIPGLIVLATLVGYLPALTAYRTDVAKTLSNSP